jgi:hypothetical protein
MRALEFTSAVKGYKGETPVSIVPGRFPLGGVGGLKLGLRERARQRANAKAAIRENGEPRNGNVNTMPIWRSAVPGLAAVQGWVADVAAGYEVDYVFGDICRVVADAFEIFRD